MENQKLISNTKFGKLCKSKESEFKTRLEYLEWYESERNSYDEFLEKGLKLGDFIPCDDDGNVFSEDGTDGDGYVLDEIMFKQYQQAKENVIFEGFIQRKEDWLSNGILDIDEEFIEDKTIEDLVKYNLTLTAKVIK